MARVPGPEQFAGRTNIASANLPGNMKAPERELARLNNALQDTGDTIIAVDQRFRKDREDINDVAFRADIAARGRPTLEAEYLAASEELDPTSDDYLPQLEQRLQQAEQGVINSALEVSGQARQESMNAAQVGMASARANLMIRAMSDRHNSSVKKSELAINNAINEFPAQAFNSPEEIPRLLQEAEQLISAGSRYVKDPVKASREARSSIVLAGVRGMIEKNTDAALDVLMTGQFNDDIPESEFGPLVTLAMQELDKQEASLNKQGKALRESVEREVLANIYSNDPPTMGDITGLLDRGLIGTDGFATLKSAIEAQKAGPKDSDTSTRLSLLQSAMDGDESVKTRVNEAVAAGTLVQDDAAAILKTLNSASDDGGLLKNSEVKRQLDLMQNVLVSRDPFGNIMGDENDRVRYFNLTNDFVDRVEAAVEAGSSPEAAARKVAGEIIEQNRKKVPQASELPQPAYRVGPSDGPDIIATKRAILNALTSGEITEPMAVEETLRIEAIEQAIKKREEDIRSGKFDSNIKVKE